MAEWPYVEYQELSAQQRSSFSMGPFGSKITKENYVDAGVPLVRGVNLARGIFVDDEFVFINEEKADELISANVEPGDLIFTHRGTIGQVSMIPRTPRFDRYVIGSSQVKTRLDESIALPEFYYYWFQSSEGQRSILANASTVGVPGIATPLTSIRKLHVPLPPRREQEGIVAVLGALDNKIAVNERIRDTALGLASTCYEAARATCEPERIGGLAALFDGPHATPQKTEAGPWFLSISSLKNGYLDLAESAHLSEGDFPRWTRRVQPQAGDVLFSYETRLGDAALMPPGVRGSLGRRMALLRSKSTSVSGALLLHAYLSSPFQEEIKRRKIHGATVDRLPLKEMPSWPILLPIQDERERLSAQLDLLHARLTQAMSENHALATLRDVLLPQLMSGKLRVRDAEKIVEDAV